MSKFEGRNADRIESAGRRPWISPRVTHLRAGSAENTRGNRVNDAILESIGS